MNEVTLVKQSYQLIRKDFGLEVEMEFEGGKNGFDRLEDFLTKQVNYLLDNDLNRLMNALYRIDIPEQRAKELLHDSQQGQIARNLARAIIEREKQKIIMRQKYQP
ncbi:hypothetical protein [Ekhidna sp.]|uniref:hypothetical protein n=1 Tax=Ekhidna sp. TaxID=2608089 RepID=UPI003298EBF1